MTRLRNVVATPDEEDIKAANEKKEGDDGKKEGGEQAEKVDPANRKSALVLIGVIYFLLTITMIDFVVRICAGRASARRNLGHPLTTSNIAPEKSRIRFLGVWGGIFLKMLFWKVYGFSKITSTRHKCFEKDIFTIVVAISTEPYFLLHIC